MKLLLYDIETQTLAKVDEPDSEGQSYFWTEGNFGCDCNRATCFGMDCTRVPCGHLRFKIVQSDDPLIPAEFIVPEGVA